MNYPFSSLHHFRQQFNQGLQSLVDKQQLGTFILCLANASNDARLFGELKSQLLKQYQQLFSKYQIAFQSGNPVDEVDEDLLVFLKLHATGFEQLQLTQQRVESHWHCQFNQLRSFRPRRMTKFQHQGEICTPFIESHFNFNKPFMAKECFWSGTFLNRPVDIFYNKYPFADLHGLLVPDRSACLPQFLERDIHHYIWQLCQQMAENLPGIGLGYNSYGAYASVNHLHFQMFIEAQGLPVSHTHWQHNGGEQPYPLNLVKCVDGEVAWQIIDQLHTDKQPYNLLYMPGEIYIMPRKRQGSVEVPHWSSGFTWYELSGGILLFNQQSYKSISETEISALLAELSVNPNISCERFI